MDVDICGWSPSQVISGFFARLPLLLLPSSLIPLLFLLLILVARWMVKPILCYRVSTWSGFPSPLLTSHPVGRRSLWLDKENGFTFMTWSGEGSPGYRRLGVGMSCGYHMQIMWLSCAGRDCHVQVMWLSRACRIEESLSVFSPRSGHNTVHVLYCHVIHMDKFLDLHMIITWSLSDNHVHNLSKIEELLMLVFSDSVGHKDVTFTQFEVSPDNQLLAFVGKDGYIPLVSNKVGPFLSPPLSCFCTAMINVAPLFHSLLD